MSEHKGFVRPNGSVTFDPLKAPFVGELSYKEDRYNLRRVLVVRRWIATRKSDGEKREFARRRDAVSWLVTRPGDG